MTNLKKAMQKANENSKGRWDVFESLDNPNTFTVIFLPTGDTPYNGGVFFAEITYLKYPLYPPRVKMATPIFHPNYCNQQGHEGNMYVDKLYEGFKISMDMNELLEYMWNLFYQPSLKGDCICNPNAYNLYKNARQEYKKEAQKWTQLYAT